MIGKSLMQFSVDGQGCVPSLLFGLRPHYGGGDEGNGDLLQKVPCIHCYTQCPQACSRPLPTHASTRDSCPGVFVPSKSLFPRSCVSSGGSIVGLTMTSSKRAYAIPRSAGPLPLRQSAADLYLHRRHSNTALSQSLWGLWVLVHTRFV